MYRYRSALLFGLIVPLLAAAACSSLSANSSGPTPIPYGTQAMLTLTPGVEGASATGSAPMRAEQSTATPTFVPPPTSASGRMVISPDQAAHLGLVSNPVMSGGEGVQSLHWSADSRLLVIGLTTGIEIMDPISNERWLTRMEPAPALDVSFSPDGRLLGMVHPEPLLAVHLWNVADDTVLADWHDRLGNPISYAFSPDPDIFATGYPDGTLAVWSFSRGGSDYTYDVTQIMEEGGMITDVEFSPDGAAVAAVIRHTDGLSHVVAWDLASGAVLLSYDPEEYVAEAGPAVYPLISPDWRYLVWVAGDTVILVDFYAGREVHRLEHISAVQAITISADSRLVATSSIKTLSGQESPAVTIWDTATGAPISDIFSFQTVPPALAFSPDGALLAIASTNEVQVWGILNGMNH